jgi:hypothetical protein
MNFLEALEANKTRRVRLVAHAEEPQKKLQWYEVDEMRECAREPHDQAAYFDIHNFEGKWEAEPEKFTFNCRWEKENTLSPTYPILGPQDSRFHKDGISYFAGKKTKVTVEVIE